MIVIKLNLNDISRSTPGEVGGLLDDIVPTPPMRCFDENEVSLQRGVNK